LLWIVVAAIIVWGVWAFGSEAMLYLRLNEQVDALRGQNAQLASSNAQAQRELRTASSPQSMEELARQEGFVRPGERVYVIVSPQPTALTGSPGQVRARKPSGVAGTLRAAGDAVVRWWRGLFR
jgi:cell division protein FtsB